MGTGDRAANLAAARLFEEIARSLEIAGEQSHRVRAYRRAARSLAATPEAIQELAAENRLRDLHGIGAAMAALIAEFLETGTMRTHDRLVSQYPPGLAPVLNARGFGPATVQALYAATGVTDLDEIERAAEDGRLAQALGPRRAKQLRVELPALRNPIRTLRLKSAWETATAIIALLDHPRTRPERIQVTGASRRMCDSVVGGLDIVAIPGSSGATALLDLFEQLPQVVQVVERDADSARARLYDGVEVRLYLTNTASWGTALVRHTGSAAHLARLGRLRDGATEEDVYAALGLPWIAPELREDSGEIEAAREGTLPRLIQQADLKGDLHCHTEWTDGVDSLEDMARAARARGYAYMALTDHSRSLAITNGLSLERLEEARRLVDQLNHQLAPFAILLGTEMDILEHGSLDYPDETLASLDYVSASIHSRFKQPESLMTARIVRAVRHPLVHTLNHPHGRLLGARPAYAVDMQRVIQAAATSGCCLEVSADPARMDLDGGWARRVREVGGRCTVSSDAHSTLDFDNIWLGVGSARRGWLEAAHVINTRPLPELRTLLKRKVWEP
jgi:DNA polymerase (family 10)